MSSQRQDLLTLHCPGYPEPIVVRAHPPSTGTPPQVEAEFLDGSTVANPSVLKLAIMRAKPHLERLSDLVQISMYVPHDKKESKRSRKLEHRFKCKILDGTHSKRSHSGNDRDRDLPCQCLATTCPFVIVARPGASRWTTMCEGVDVSGAAITLTQDGTVTFALARNSADRLPARTKSDVKHTLQLPLRPEGQSTGVYIHTLSGKFVADEYYLQVCQATGRPPIMSRQFAGPSVH